MAWGLLIPERIDPTNRHSVFRNVSAERTITVSWAILMAALEVIGIYFLLTVVSYLWQERTSGHSLR